MFQRSQHMLKSNKEIECVAYCASLHISYIHTLVLSKLSKSCFCCRSPQAFPGSHSSLSRPWPGPGPRWRCRVPWCRLIHRRPLNGHLMGPCLSSSPRPPPPAVWNSGERTTFEMGFYASRRSASRMRGSISVSRPTPTEWWRVQRRVSK